MFEHDRRKQDERLELEFLDRNAVTRSGEALDHVILGLVVARCAGSAYSIVGIGDRLQVRLMLAYAVKRDALEQLRHGVVHTRVTA